MCAGQATAETIHLEHAGVASGTLTLGSGAVTFIDASFVISAVGNTDDRREMFQFPGSDPYGYEIVHASASIEIEGVGTFALLTETRTFAIPAGDGVGRIGLGRTQASGLLDLFNGPEMAEFAAWDMMSSLELTSDAGGRVMQWDASPVVTDGGVLFLRYDRSAPWRFTATLAPTPGGAVLLGAAGLFAGRRRR